MTTFPTFTILSTGQEITFTSSFATLADAYRALDAAPRKTQFAHDLRVVCVSCADREEVQP